MSRAEGSRRRIERARRAGALALAVTAALAVAVVAVVNAAGAGAEGSELLHYEYVFQPGKMSVYNMDREGQPLVTEVPLPDSDGVRGVIASVANHILYVSHGGDGGSFGNGGLFAYDLLTNKVLWNRSYPFGVDSGAITPDGRTIYMPTGENDPSGIWNVLDATTGEKVSQIQSGANAHNTIVSLDGSYAFLGGRNANHLDVVNTATNKVVREIGPLITGVRPFTVNGSDTLAFTTATKTLGFQVSSIAIGHVLYTQNVPGFGIPEGFALTAPSHGIALSPDEKQLYLMDGANGYVHVFDVSGLPASAPHLIASIKLSPMLGKENPCAYDCEKAGWLQPSLDGRFLYVGDSGDVIDARTLKVVTHLPALAQTREMLEVDWKGGVPVATSTRYGLGYVRKGSGEEGEKEHHEEEHHEEEHHEEKHHEEEHRGEEPHREESTGGSPHGEEHSASGGGVQQPQTPVTTGAGSIAPPAQWASQIVLPPPEISRMTISRSELLAVGASSHRGDAAARSATVAYQDSQAATTTFEILAMRTGVRTARGCTLAHHSSSRARARDCSLYEPVASFHRHDGQGANAFAISARLGRATLRPGRFVLSAQPATGARVGTAVKLGFSVVR